MPCPTCRERNTINVESARPAAGRQRETKVAENGLPVTAVRGSVIGPVDQHLEPREEPGVPNEEALGRTGDDVAGAAADGEGGLIDQGHDA